MKQVAIFLLKGGSFITDGESIKVKKVINFTQVEANVTI